MELDKSNTSFMSVCNLGKIPNIVFGIFAFCLVAVSQLKAPSPFVKNRQLLSPPAMVEHISFGFNESIADLLWIRSIQDFDYCDKPIAKNICRNDSWLFQMLDAVSNLSPHFRMVYATGGLALTVILSDIDGATKIFDKGVQAFPNDWPIVYRAAYHYLYELKDKKHAADLLIQAGKSGAPSWVFTLAGRLYSDSGELELAEKLLLEMKAENQDEHLIQRLQDKIDSMKATKQQSNNSLLRAFFFA